ncbi:flavin-containing monooxygenase [Streptomyces sp. Y7]|uniref:flavin-containing monooxygenase n=1 Tax=Streptomyces sp. Y7 TaxID=3342392 RepID=UPI0037121970
MYRSVADEPAAVTGEYSAVFERPELEPLLAEADIPVLLMVLVHLTGDRGWLEPPFLPERTGRIFAEESGGLPAEVQARVRAAAADALLAGGPPALPDPDDETLHRMMGVCVGEEIPAEYVPVARVEMGLEPEVLPDVDTGRRVPRVLIIGAGVSGICAAVRFERMGLPYEIVEKNESVGGTWFENTYPEAGVDTPNHFYSYTFARDHTWGHYFAKQPEILNYLRTVAERYGIVDKIRFGTRVTESRWDEAEAKWISTVVDPEGAEKRLESDVLITAVGQLNQPRLPDIPGLDTFGGELFHMANWPTGARLEGKRVALVGTGASAVQAARSIAEKAAHLTVLQRSPQWLMPNPDYHRAVSPAKQRLISDVPFYASWYRFTLFWRYGDGLHPTLQVDLGWAHPERSVNEVNDAHRGFLTRYMEKKLDGRPDLLEKCLPDYPPYGKRMVVDNTWFETLRRDDVDLVASGVAEVTADGIRADDGTFEEVDAIVFATGFNPTRMLWPLEVVGRDGVSIHERWHEDDPSAYLGMTVPGYPNLFMLLGPNTALAHGGSVIFHVEAQVNYISRLVAAMMAEGHRAIEPTEAACEEYTREVQAAHERMVFSHPGMRNWYKNRAGRVVTVSPWRLVDYWSRTREPDLDAFVTS